MISKRSIRPPLELAMDSGIRRTTHSVGEAFGNRPQPASPAFKHSLEDGYLALF